MHCVQVGFVSEMQKEKKKKPTNTIHLIDRIEEKPYTIILVDTEKDIFDKIQYPSMIITQPIRNKKELPQTDKINCKKYLELTSYFRVKSKTSS